MKALTPATFFFDPLVNLALTLALALPCGRDHCLKVDSASLLVQVHVQV
jgi:hypothetical protein